MEKGPSIKKNYIYNTLYQVFTLLIPLVTAPYLSRILEPDGIGIQSYTTSVNNYFVMFAMLGTASYGQREIAQHRNDKRETSRIFWGIEILTLLTTMVCLLGWGILIIFSKDYRCYYLIMTFHIIGAALDITWFFYGLEMFQLIVIRNTIIKIVGTVLIFVFVRKKDDLLTYMALNAWIVMLGNLSMWGYLKKFLVKIDWKKLQIRKHFKQTIVYFLPTVATSIYTVLDKTMIGMITEDTFENGYYEQTNKIVNMATAVCCSLNTVMSSRMSYLFAEKREHEIKDKLAKSLDYSIFLAIFIWFGIIGCAEGFVPWFYGRGYDNVILLLRIYSPLVLIIGISNCLGGQLLTPSGQRARSMKGIVLGAIVNFLLNLILIPKLRAKGAAISSLIAEGTITLCYIYMGKQYIKINKLGKRICKSFFAGSIMALILIFFVNIWSASILHSIFEICIALFVYSGVLLLLKDEFLRECLSKAGNWIRNRTTSK